MSRIDFLRTAHKLTAKEESFLTEVDPLGKTWLWLIRGIRQPGFCKNVPEVQAAIDSFNKLRVSPKFKAAGFNPDLTSYTWKNLQEVLAESQELKSNKQLVKEYVGAKHIMSYMGGFEVYRTDGVENAPAVIQLGSGSSWCTNTGAQTAADYLQTGPIYNVMFRDRPYAQFSPSRHQFNDPRNGNFLQHKGKQTVLRNPKLYYLLCQLAQDDKAVEKMIANLLVVKQPDFNYIYTVEEPKQVCYESGKRFLKKCLDRDLAAIDWFLRDCSAQILTWAATDPTMATDSPYVGKIARSIQDERHVKAEVVA